MFHVLLCSLGPADLLHRHPVLTENNRKYFDLAQSGVCWTLVRMLFLNQHIITLWGQSSPHHTISLVHFTCKANATSFTLTYFWAKMNKIINDSDYSWPAQMDICHRLVRMLFLNGSKWWHLLYLKWSRVFWLSKTNEGGASSGLFLCTVAGMKQRLSQVIISSPGDLL